MLMPHHGHSSRTLMHSRSLFVRIRACPQHRLCSSFLGSVSSRYGARTLYPVPTGAGIPFIIPAKEFHSTRNLWKANGPVATSKDKTPIAVLGGGITGMSTAYYLTKAFPTRPIMLFETKPVLGGWIKTKTVDVGDGEITFESGPRSLRPADSGSLSLTLVQELDLIKDLLVTDRHAAAAKNRFVYYPDHLVLMPGPGTRPMEILKSVWMEPVFSKLFAALWNDIRSAPRSPDIKDESVRSFISRRLHENLAENMVSAVFHGIYAGDISRLSAKSIMSSVWMKEAKHGNLINSFWEGLVEKRSWHFCDDMQFEYELRGYDWDPDLREMVRDCSVFTFRGGMGQLAQRLEDRLSSNPYVKILKSTNVTSIRKGTADDGIIQVEYRDKSSPTPVTKSFSHLISTIRPDTLLTLTGMVDPESMASKKIETNVMQASKLTKSLANIPAVTVCVVNFYFRTPNLLQTLQPPGGLPEALGAAGIRGFGYLLPASIPHKQNPEYALGVIFDSDISPALHSTIPQERRGTRLTVMLGGHWWDDWSSYPTDNEAQEMAMNILSRHLGITEAPAAVNVSLQKDCIPQYHVGHAERMGAAHEALWDIFGGRIRVAGSWFTGVGVNDCVRSGWEVVEGLKADKSPNRRHVRRTGLEKFDGDRPTVLLERLKSGTLEIVDVQPRGEAANEFVEQMLRKGVQKKTPRDG